MARLAAKLDVPPATLRAALRQLEAEGLLGGRARHITDHGQARRRLRVGILPHDVPLLQQVKTDHVLTLVRHELEAAGHSGFYTSRSQAKLQHDEVHPAHMAQSEGFTAGRTSCAP